MSSAEVNVEDKSNPSTALGSRFSAAGAFADSEFDALSDLCRLFLSAASAVRKVDVGSLSSISRGTPANPEYSRPSVFRANGMFIQTSEVNSTVRGDIFTALYQFF